MTQLITFIYRKICLKRAGVISTTIHLYSFSTTYKFNNYEEMSIGTVHTVPTS